jgi:hypothetical protein
MIGQSRRASATASKKTRSVVGSSICAVISNRRAQSRHSSLGQHEDSDSEEEEKSQQ